MMNEEEKNPWKILSAKTVYENPWIRVDESQTEMDGHEGIYGVVHFKSFAIGIMALDDEMNTWLVGQYRFPLNEYSWEIPEGGGLRSVDPLESAKRELKEETGIEAADWKLIYKSALSNSATDELAFIFLARKLSFGTSSPDHDEKLALKKISFADFYSLVVDNKVTDAITCLAAFVVKSLMDCGEI